MLKMVYCFGQTKEECEYLVSLAKPHMEKSTVVDSETGKSKDSRYAILTSLFSLLLHIIWKFPSPFSLFVCFYFFVVFPSDVLPWITFICRVRTSSGTFLARGRDKLIRNIEKRIAGFTFLPVGM